MTSAISLRMIHGTHIEFLYRQQSIIIASDSMVTFEAKPIEDKACKILVLDPSAVFAAAGPLVTVISTSTNGEVRELLNSYEIARGAFLSSRDIRAAADNWVIIVADKLNEIAAQFKLSYKDGDVLVQGVFFADQNKRIEGILKQLIYAPDGNVIRVSSIEIEPGTGEISSLGAPHSELMREFVANMTDRAKNARNEMAKNCI